MDLTSDLFFCTRILAMIYVIAFCLIAIILGKTAFLDLCETSTGKEKNICGGTV
jgi:hypothetical protein